MADDSDLERTESPSQQRLEKARQEGQVARSRELGTFALMMAAGGGLWVLAPAMLAQFSSVMTHGLRLGRSDAFESGQMLIRMHSLGMEALLALAPFLGLLFVTALVSPLLLNGWLFSTGALQPKFDRLNPLSGLGRMFSATSAVELVKAVGKTLLVGGIAVLVVWKNIDSVFALSGMPLGEAIVQAARLTGLCFLYIAASLVLIAAIDVPWQLWQHNKKLRMTRQELRQEARESEGDPQVKARVRAQQREMSRRRMMAEVPKADVVVTNPSHYAVALRYDGDGMRAPRVVAMGSQLLALRIREVALENAVPVLEAPPLARALYHNAELGDEIPELLYNAVAEVLAYVFQLRRSGTTGGYGVASPVPPTDLPVPPHLDPGPDPQ